MSPGLTARQQALLDIVRRLQCAPASSIAVLYGASTERAVYSLRILRKRGLVCCSCDHRGARWYTPENSGYAEAVRNDHKEAMRLADMERRRKRKAAKAALQRKYREQAAERWERGMTQRIVPAVGAPPLRVTAPNSIFNLAQCA